MALNEKFQEHHENVSEFFSLSGRTLKNKTGFVKGKKKRVNPVTIKTVTAAAAVAVAASVVMAIYVRCIPLEIGKSYADIEVKTINADAGSDVDYYLVKGIDSVDKNNFKRYLNTALIAEKGNLDLTDPTMEFERLLAKTGYQLVFTYIDENGEEQFAGSYSFTTGPVVSPVAEKIKEVVEKVTGHKFEEKDNPRDNPPEESREEPPAPPVSESVPEVIPPVSESVSEVIPPPPPPPPVPSESVPETTQSEPPAPEPSPDPGPGPSPNPPPAQDGVTGDAASYVARENANNSSIEFTMEFPFTENASGASITGGDYEIIYENTGDGQTNETNSIPMDGFVPKSGKKVYTKMMPVGSLYDGFKLGVSARYTQDGVEKSTPKTYFEVSPAGLKPSYGETPEPGATKGTFSNIKYDSAQQKLTFDYSLSNIVNPQKPAGSYFKIDSIYIRIQGTEGTTFDYYEPLPMNGPIEVRGTSLNRSETLNINLADGKYIIELNFEGSWVVKNSDGSYLNSNQVNSSFGMSTYPDMNLLVGTPSVKINTNRAPRYSADDGIHAQITGLSTSQAGPFDQPDITAKVGTTLYVSMDVIGNAAGADYDLTSVALGGITPAGDKPVNITFTPVGQAPGNNSPMLIEAGKTKNIVYSFTVPNEAADIQLNSITADKRLTYTADTAEKTFGGTYKIAGIASKADPNTFGAAISATKGEEIRIKVDVTNTSTVNKLKVNALNFTLGGQAVTATPETQLPLVLEPSVVDAPPNTASVIYKFTADAGGEIILGNPDENIIVKRTAGQETITPYEIDGCVFKVLGFYPDSTSTEANGTIEAFPGENIRAQVEIDNSAGTAIKKIAGINLAYNGQKLAAQLEDAAALPIHLPAGPLVDPVSIVYTFAMPDADGTVTVESAVIEPMAHIKAINEKANSHADNTDTLPYDFYLRLDPETSGMYRGDNGGFYVDIPKNATEFNINLNGEFYVTNPGVTERPQTPVAETFKVAIYMVNGAERKQFRNGPIDLTFTAGTGGDQIAPINTLLEGIPKAGIDAIEFDIIYTP